MVELRFFYGEIVVLVGSCGSGSVVRLSNVSSIVARTWEEIGSLSTGAIATRASYAPDTMRSI